MVMKQIKNRHLVVFVVLVVTLSFVSTSVGSPLTSVPLKKIQNLIRPADSFDQRIRLLMFVGYIPSLSGCIIKNTSMTWSQGYGFYDFTSFKRPTKDTIYHVGSVSKTVTATAILQLYEQGRFGLDDDVNAYLPFSLRNPRYPDVPITFRMLLAHHSSITNETAAYPFMYENHPYSYIKELLVPGGEAYHEGFWGTSPPGHGGNYSNMGFIILGYLLEILSGQSLEQYCQDHIFQPLGMHNTSFDMTTLDENNMAKSYNRFGRLYFETPLIDFTFLDPAGGLLTTVNDLSIFLIAHMNKGQHHGIRILNETTIALMHSIQYPASVPYAGIIRFGLGWLFFEGENGVRTNGHDGGVTNFQSRMRVFYNNTTAIIYFINKGYRPNILFPRTIPDNLEALCDNTIRKLLYQKASQIAS
jgi:CubicO group peptidase (beta-lactamase class C family)